MAGLAGVLLHVGAFDVHVAPAAIRQQQPHAACRHTGRLAHSWRAR